MFLWAHDYRQPPVAKCVEISGGADLRAVAEFPERGVYPFADTVQDLVPAGIINAVSVGFRVLDDDFNVGPDGVVWAEKELLEISFVPVPANPEALVIARGAGLDERRIKEFFVEGATRTLVDDDRHVLDLDDDALGLRGRETEVDLGDLLAVHASPGCRFVANFPDE